MKVKLVHGGGGGGMRKLAWHFWGGTLCYRGESSHDCALGSSDARLPVMLPCLSKSTDTAGKGPHVVFPASLQEPLAA